MIWSKLNGGTYGALSQALLSKEHLSGEMVIADIYDFVTADYEEECKAFDIYRDLRARLDKMSA